MGADCSWLSHSELLNLPNVTFPKGKHLVLSPSPVLSPQPFSFLLHATPLTRSSRSGSKPFLVLFPFPFVQKSCWISSPYKKRKHGRELAVPTCTITISCSNAIHMLPPLWHEEGDFLL